MDSPANGALSYVEVPVDDVARAKAFYAEVFGWTYQESPAMDYTFFDSGDGGIGGGVVQREEQRPPHPVCYLMCDHIDETLEHVTNAGGNVVVVKTQFGKAGWLAKATDTEGNLIGLWQAADA